MQNQPSDPTNKVIDIRSVGKRIKDHRKAYYIIVPIIFVVSCALILCVPRYYTVDVILAPESQSVQAGGALSSLASSFGFDFGSMSEDAIHPNIYPDVVSSTDFLVGLFGVRITKNDASYDGNYYQYLCTERRYPFWKVCMSWVKRLLTPKTDDSFASSSDMSKPFRLTKVEREVVGIMKDDIKCSMDKKTDLITISVTDQDALVAAQMADSVKNHLQEFMAIYRTRKAVQDVLYYKGLTDSSYVEYMQANDRYIRYVDSHSNMSLERYRAEASILQDEKDLKYSAYSSFQKQYMASQAKLQEKMPVFVTIQSASVPIRPTGPKRVVFVLLMTFLGAVLMTTWYCRREIMILF